MELLKWDGTMSVGIDIFDEEHEKLTAYINQLYCLVMNKGDTESLKKIFDELMDYAKFHFHHEEVLFMDTDYPKKEQEAHVREHEELTAKLLEIHNELENGNAEIISRELLDFMVGWLMQHTEGVDARYVPYVKKKLGID